jgi:hypothetical protein
MSYSKILVAIFSMLLLIGTYQVKDSYGQTRRRVRPAPSKPISTQTATTDDGKKVILKSDGTWVYALPADSEANNSDTAEDRDLIKLIKSIKEVETDQVNFIGKPFIINGTIEPSSFYNYGYGNAQTTHYSYEMRDASGKVAYVYLSRQSKYAAQLREELLKAKGNVLRAGCLVTILPDRVQASLSIFAELLACSPPIRQ